MNQAAYIKGYMEKMGKMDPNISLGLRTPALALSGAGIGAGIGALTSRKNRLRNSLIGALAGGAAGLGAGSYATTLDSSGLGWNRTVEERKQWVEKLLKAYDDSHKKTTTTGLPIVIRDMAYDAASTYEPSMLEKLMAKGR